MSEQRRAEIANIRGVLDQREVLRTEATYESAEAGRITYRNMGKAERGSDTRQVVVVL